MKIMAFIAAALVTATIATSAGAEVIRNEAAASYGDLDLASAAGQVTLAKRIGVAAGTACGVDKNVRDLRTRWITDRCHDAAIARINLFIASAATLVYASR